MLLAHMLVLLQSSYGKTVALAQGITLPFLPARACVCAVHLSFYRKH